MSPNADRPIMKPRTPPPGLLLLVSTHFPSRLRNQTLIQPFRIRESGDGSLFSWLVTCGEASVGGSGFLQPIAFLRIASPVSGASHQIGLGLSRAHLT